MSKYRASLVGSLKDEKDLPAAKEIIREAAAKLAALGPSVGRLHVVDEEVFGQAAKKQRTEEMRAGRQARIDAIRAKRAAAAETATDPK